MNKKKRLTDENGLVFKEVSYDEYLNSKNKLRIIKHLESQYFVEVSAKTEKTTQ